MGSDGLAMEGWAADWLDMYAADSTSLYTHTTSFHKENITKFMLSSLFNPRSSSILIACLFLHYLIIFQIYLFFYLFLFYYY